MKIDASDFNAIDLLHEHLALDFTNTTPYHANLSEDHLRTYADLLSWGLDVGILSDEDANRLLDIAADRPDEAEAVLQKAIRVREALYEILSAIAAEQTPTTADLDTFNDGLSEAMAHMRIVAAEDGFGWNWVDGEDNLERMLWPAVWSAAELLMSDDLKYVRECGGNDCDWLFLDTSRNHSRRWCSMETCGNRAKARRHYQRARSDN